MKRAAITFVIIFFTIQSFAQAKKTENSKPFVIGVIDELESVQLKEKRVVNIYLPEGYSKTDTVKYPVIYLLDGSADEDFTHIAGLVQFNSFSWVNRIPKSIVVGIANVDRKRDFTFPSAIEEDRKLLPTSGHSDKFIAFLEKELQPFIERKYKTNSAKTIIGESLGGLLATEILLKKPTLFNKFIIVSPSLWWNDGSILSHSPDVLKGTEQKISVYIGVGKEGLAPGKNPRVMEVDANLLAEKLKLTTSKNLKVYFDYLPKEDHGTIGHQAVFNAFKMMASKQEDK